jgi:hypothetical protein
MPALSRPIRRHALLLCVPFILAGCVAPTSTKTTSSTGTDTTNTASTAAAESSAPALPKVTLVSGGDVANLDVIKPGAFEGAQKVLVAGFKVGFVQSKGDSARAGGGLTGGAFGGKSTALMDMEGVDPTLMQTLTDKAYEHFMGQLDKAGFEVVPRSALYDLDSFKKVKRYPFPYEVDNSGWFSDYGVSTYYIPTVLGGDAPIWQGEINGVTGGIGFSNPAYATSEFAEESDIKILTVKYLIDFAYTDAYGDSFWSSSSKIDVGQAVYVTPGATMGFVGGWGTAFNSQIGNLSLKESIIASNQVGSLEDVTTSTEKAVELLSNVVGVLGGMGTNKSRKYRLVADPVEYEKAAEEVAFNLNSNFIQKMIDLR